MNENQSTKQPTINSLTQSLFEKRGSAKSYKNLLKDLWHEWLLSEFSDDGLTRGMPPVIMRSYMIFWNL